MIIVVDTETTGLDPENGSIVEIATVQMPSFHWFSTIVKPNHPIDIEAMAAHHITEEEAAKGESFESAIKDSRINDADQVAAHNAAFDFPFLKIDKPQICTWRCARQLWPDSPRHSNQVLRYYLGLNSKIHEGVGSKIMKLPPHRALPDAWVTAHILNRMLDLKTAEELVELTKMPILMKTCHFGKYRGTLWEEVPKDYLRWMVKQTPGFDSDTEYTAKYHLGMV